MQKNLVKQQKRNWSESKTSQVIDWKGGWLGCRVKALPPFPSLDYHSARFAHLFSPLWSWVPGQMDKEKGAVQSLLGKHQKLVLKKKQTWFWHLPFTPNCKINVVIGKYRRKKRQRKRGNWRKLDKNKLGTPTTFTNLVWRKMKQKTSTI